MVKGEKKKPKKVESDESEEDKPESKKELVDELHKLLKKEVAIKNKMKLIDGAVISSKQEALNELTNQLMRNKQDIDALSIKISLKK